MELRKNCRKLTTALSRFWHREAGPMNWKNPVHVVAYIGWEIFNGAAFLVGEWVRYGVRASQIVMTIPPTVIFFFGGAWYAVWHFVRRPFPALETVPLLDLLEYHNPTFYSAVVVWYYLSPLVVVMLGGSIVLSIWKVWIEARKRDLIPFGALPAWPLFPEQPGPEIVIGEVHHPVEAREIFNPEWLTIPERGLYTGIAIFGAVGSGKTSACMHPFAKQLLGWQADDPEKRAAALMLEVKGDFCHDIRSILDGACRGESGKEMRAEWSPELEQKLKKLTIQPRIVWEPGAGDDVRERVAAVKRWFENDWQKLDNKIKSSIVEGVSVFLSMFDMPDVAAVFCPPPPEVSDDPRRIGPKARAAILAGAKAQAEGEDSAEKKAQESRQWPADTITERPRHLPPLYELIEGGKVLALNMPAGSNPALARAIGVMLKNAWLQALLMRPAQMKESPTDYFRPAVFICDEYQSFASVGEDDPTGDEKSFALDPAMPVHPDCCDPIHILIAGRAWQFGGVAGAFADAPHPDLFYP